MKILRRSNENRRELRDQTGGLFRPADGERLIRPVRHAQIKARLKMVAKFSAQAALRKANAV